MSGMVRSSSPGSVKGGCAPGVKVEGCMGAQAQTTVPVGLSTGNGASSGATLSSGIRTMTAMPSPGDGAGRHRAAVGSHDGRDDRKPQTAAALVRDRAGSAR